MAATPLLGLTLPVSGTLAGTWGDAVNNEITSLLDTAVAGTTTISTDADVTLTSTASVANQARSAVLVFSGARTALRTITAPAQSKTYAVVNKTTGGFSVKIVGAGPTTGLTIANGEEALIAWDGSDFVRVSTVGGPVSGTTGTFTGALSATSGTFTDASTITANSSSAALRVTQTGAGNALLVEDSANPDATPLVVDASGRLVVGNTAPILSLGVTPSNQTLGSVDATATLLAARFSANANGPNLFLGKSRSTTVGTLGTVVNSGDTLGIIQFLGDDGTSLVRGASIAGVAEGAPSTGSVPAYLTLQTTLAGDVTPTERMRIASTGVFGFNSNIVVGGASGQYRYAGNITGAVNSSGITYTPTIKSDVTGSCAVFESLPSTEDVAFTLGVLVHYRANQGTITGGSRTPPTSQYGFLASSSLSGATNNFGFRGDIASGTGRYNLYMAGSADNYMAGALGIGSTALTATSLRLGRTITGATTAYGVYNAGTIQTDVTTLASYFTSVATTAASTTVGAIEHYTAVQGTFSGTSVTSQRGFKASSTLTGATNNYGFQSDLAAATGAWNFYAAGTAQNYMAGNLGLGITVPTEKLDVSGNIKATGNIQSASLNNGQLAGMRNRFINGGMQVAQRLANTLLLTTSYNFGTTDRWMFACLGGTAVSGDISNIRDFSATTPGWRSGVTSATWTNGIFSAQQRIESKNTLDLTGKTITISFNIFQTSGSTRSFNVALLRPVLIDDFTSTTTITTIAAGSAASGAPTTLSVSYTFGASDAINGIAVVISDTAANTIVGTVEYSIAYCQFEIGTVATPLELRPYGLELLLCQRYYEKSFPTATAPAQNLGIAASGATRFIAGKAGAAAQFGHVKFSVTKRAAPATIVFYNPSAANAQVRDTTAGVDLSATAAANASESSFDITATGNAATAVGNALDIAWTADSEL